jgi:hypothetical protein
VCLNQLTVHEAVRMGRAQLCLWTLQWPEEGKGCVLLETAAR